MCNFYLSIKIIFLKKHKRVDLELTCFIRGGPLWWAFTVEGWSSHWLPHCKLTANCNGWAGV